MFRRQTTGSVLCTSCGTLVGVNDERCDNCGRRNPGLWGFAPALRRLGNDMGFIPMVIVACAGIYVVTLLVSGREIRMGGLLSILSPNLQSLFLLGASGAVPVFEFGRWWTIASAGWLHGSLLHILFNMMWVRQLGPVTAELYGPGRMIVIYTVAGICGFVLSTMAGLLLGWLPLSLLRGAQFTVGASASIFGLLGALVYYGRRAGSRVVGGEAMGYAMALFIFGLIMPGVDNYAHAGGFGGGYAAAKWLDPLKPERIDHLVAALICIGLSALAILASIVHGVRLFLS